MKTYGEVQAVVKLCWELDVDIKCWADYTANDEVKCLVDCNDLFFWGCADAEEIELCDLPLLQQAYDELHALSLTNTNLSGITAYTDWLYCCKKRSMRPQGAIYDNRPKEMWPLFNACGPHRPAEFGNPKETPE